MFRIGERAWLWADPKNLQKHDQESLGASYNGGEVTVVSALIPCAYARGGFCYLVRADDGFEFGAIPEVLHKLPPLPPREDLRVVSWDHCVWRPARVPEAA